MGPWWMTMQRLEQEARLLRDRIVAVEDGPLVATSAGARARVALLEAAGAMARAEPPAGDRVVSDAWLALARAQLAVDEVLTLPDAPRTAALPSRLTT